MGTPVGPRFLDAAADWADSRKVDMAFTRDRYGDWSATIHLKDARGPFVAVVAYPPEWDKKAPQDFAERVAKACTQAVVHARRERMTNHTRVPLARYYEARA